jgi:hypothetical protein
MTNTECPDPGFLTVCRHVFIALSDCWAWPAAAFYAASRALLVTGAR